MKRLLFLSFFVVFVGWGLLLYNIGFSTTPSVSDWEAGFDEPEETDDLVHPRLRGLDHFVRPAGPWRVGLQIGHFNAQDAPEEQINLRTNTGASSSGVTELEVNTTIAKITKSLLEKEGFIVDLLPVTIPPNYFADLFIALHADGNDSFWVSGFKVASPRRDFSSQAASFASLLEASYAKATKLPKDLNITRNMTGYYAFNWRRYDHSLHPMTPAVILETGFVTSPSDRRIIVRQPELSAQGIVEAVKTFFSSKTP